MIEISRDYVFQAAHHLPGTPEDHKCHGMHGHTWEVRIVVTGPIDPITGWIVDYAELDKVWNEAVHTKLDHSVLNDTITNPTTEHICMWIYATTAEKVSAIGARVVRIEITEGGRGRAVLHVDSEVRRVADDADPEMKTRREDTLEGLRHEVDRLRDRVRQWTELTTEHADELPDEFVDASNRIWFETLPEADPYPPRRAYRTRSTACFKIKLTVDLASNQNPGYVHRAGATGIVVERLGMNAWLVEIRVPDTTLEGDAWYETLEVRYNEFFVIQPQEEGQHG